MRLLHRMQVSRPNIMATLPNAIPPAIEDRTPSAIIAVKVHKIAIPKSVVIDVYQINSPLSMSLIQPLSINFVLNVQPLFLLACCIVTANSAAISLRIPTRELFHEVDYDHELRAHSQYASFLAKNL